MKNFKNFYYIILWNFITEAIELIYWDKSKHSYIKREIYRCRSLPRRSEVVDINSEQEAKKAIQSVYNFIYPGEYGKQPPFEIEEILDAKNQLFYWEILGRWQIGPKMIEYLKSTPADNILSVRDAMWGVYCSITNCNFPKKQFNFYIEESGCFEMRLHDWSCEKFPANRDDFNNPHRKWILLDEHNTDGGMANELAFLAGIAVLSSLTMEKFSNLYLQI